MEGGGPLNAPPKISRRIEPDFDLRFAWASFWASRPAEAWQEPTRHHLNRAAELKRRIAELGPEAMLRARSADGHYVAWVQGDTIHSRAPGDACPRVIIIGLHHHAAVGTPSQLI